MGTANQTLDRIAGIRTCDIGNLFERKLAVYIGISERQFRYNGQIADTANMFITK